MAEGILAHLLKDADPPIVVESAGVAAPEGAPASSHGLALAAEQGIQIGGHRARQLTRSLLDQADLVLTMEESHKREVLSMAPFLGGRVEVLTAFAGGGSEGVPDPIGGDRRIYKETFDLLEDLSRRAAPVIVKLAEEKASRSSEQGAGGGRRREADGGMR